MKTAACEGLEKRALLSGISQELLPAILTDSPLENATTGPSIAPATSSVASTASITPTASATNATPLAAEKANTPIGIARGIYPGRVSWVYDPSATPWDGATGHWWDDAGTNQNAVDRMMSRSLRALTGAATDAAAWKALFRYYNRTHGRGKTGYLRGEKIALKINLNNNTSYDDADNQLDASPQAVLAMIRQLVYNAGVPQAKITLYDAVRSIPDRIYNKIHQEFPGLIFVDNTGTHGRTLARWKGDAITYSVKNNCGTAIPTCVADATYLINMALLKGHETAGITLTAKNHYGSIDDREHTYIQSAAQPLGTYSPFVDLIGNKYLGGKTMLFMIDALYGTNDLRNAPAKWQQAPFKNRWTSSFFMSQDPVAIDSVGADFLLSEFGGKQAFMKNADNYLHEAALASSPPSQTAYHPNGDGMRLSSLGVHEHWNSSTQKQYSRNLGTGHGIELFYAKEPAIRSPRYLTNGLRRSPSLPVTFTSDSTLPVRWAVTDGALPPGMTLNRATGVYSGTPTTAGTFQFTITVTNIFGSTSKTYTQIITRRLTTKR
ncbi:MAG: DUF362 domain-containing protein [Bacillota bacterium]